jgi:hypothetical protein
MSSYRTPESLIRSIMAGQNINEGHAPALKIPEPERVNAALKVLGDNGIKSASRKDDNTITIGAAEVNMASNVLDHALANGVIQARPIMVSDNAIEVLDPTVEPHKPVPEPHPPAGGTPIGEAKEEEDESKTECMTLNKKMQIQSKIIDEEQINELSSTYTPPKRVPQRPIKKPAATKLANIADKKGMNNKDVQNILFNQGHGRKSEKLVNSIRAGMPGSTKLLTKEETTPSLKKYVSEATVVNPIGKASASIKSRIDTANKQKSNIVRKAAIGESVNPVDTVLRVYESLMLTEAAKLRLLATHHSECGKHTAKVYKDTEWGEHRVKYFINGTHHEPGDSHHGDVDDAHHTARAELKRLTKLNGALKEAYDAGDDLSWIEEEIEQVDELSRGTLKNYVIKAHDRVDSTDDKINSGERVSRKEIKKSGKTAANIVLANNKLNGKARVNAKG